MATEHDAVLLAQLPLLTAAELHELAAALVERRELLYTRRQNDPNGELRWAEPYALCTSLLTAVREARLSLQ